MKPSCYNRPAFVQIVHSDEFEVSYPFRMLESCAAWMPGGNAYVRPHGDGARGQRFKWADCDGCRWKDNVKLTGCADSKNVGLEVIDPDFVRLIEMSLMAMTDYARNKVNFEKHSGMRLVMTRDIERAEKILSRIADWHESSNARDNPPAACGRSG